MLELFLFYQTYPIAELILFKNAAVFLSITACKSFLLCQTNTCGGSSYNGKSPTPFDAGLARYKGQIIHVMHKWWTPHAWDDCLNSEMCAPNLSNQQIEYVHVDPYIGSKRVRIYWSRETWIMRWQVPYIHDPVLCPC
jgi:hypothetical protein